MLLLNSEIWLLIVALSITAITVVPSLLLSVWLDLNIKELDEEDSERVVLQVLEKSIKDLTVLLNKKVSQEGVLLLEQELLHDLKEVSTKDWYWVFILVEEGGDLVEERVVNALNWLDWLFLLLTVQVRGLNGSGLVDFLVLLVLVTIALDIFVLTVLVTIFLIVGGIFGLVSIFVLLLLLGLLEGILEADSGWLFGVSGSSWSLLFAVTTLKVLVELLDHLGNLFLFLFL